MMLRTIILQPYKKAERRIVVDVLDGLFSPKDNYVWLLLEFMFTGIIYTNGVLYIRLSVNKIVKCV